MNRKEIIEVINKLLENASEDQLGIIVSFVESYIRNPSNKS